MAITVLDKLAIAAGLPKKKLVQIFFVVILILIACGVCQSFLTTVLGVAYPVFMSFYSMENEAIDADKQWLTYWVVFGLFSIVDQFAGFILGLIPFYYVLKVAFLIWLFHPNLQGATAIYFSFVQPFWKEHESKIEEVSRGIENSVRQGIKKAGLNSNKSE